jgi:hypothetical protein
LLNEEKMEKEKKTRRKGGEHEGSTHVGRENPGEPRSATELIFQKGKKNSTYTYVGSRGNLESLAEGERTRNWFPRSAAAQG